MSANAVADREHDARSLDEHFRDNPKLGSRQWRRMQRENAQRAYILENSHSPVLTFCPKGLLRWCNRGFEKLTGTTAEQLRGCSYVDMVSGFKENRASLARVRRAATQGEPAFDIEFLLRHASGRLIWVAVDVHPQFDDGQLSQVAVMGFDITERKRNETLKTDFVSLVGHELRTPLTVVSGALDAMAAGMVAKPDPNILELVEMGQRNCTRLRRLIENLLDVNRIETGVVIYQLQRLRIEESVERVLRVLSIELHEAGLALDDSAVDDGHVVQADPARVEQVLTHLLSNAIKFSHPGCSIIVSSEVVADEKIRISVTDQGPGISADFAPRVFEKFARAPDVLASGVEGFGLGLSIAQGLVASMDGRIGYHANEDGPGCQFWFELPASDKESPDYLPGEEP